MRCSFGQTVSDVDVGRSGWVGEWVGGSVQVVHGLPFAAPTTLFSPTPNASAPVQHQHTMSCQFTLPTGNAYIHTHTRHPSHTQTLSRKNSLSDTRMQALIKQEH